MPTKTATTLIDISLPVHPGMPTFPGDPGVEFEPALDMDCGGAANVTRLHIGSQTGTHYDAPDHILNNGVTIEQIPLDLCYGPALVIEIPTDVQAITAEVLQAYDLKNCERLLLKTRNSGFWQSSPRAFRKDFAAPTPDGAAYLVEQGIRLVATDYLSIELFDSEGLGVHKTLMNNNVVIMEGINLSGVEPGWYTLCAFPVLYQGLDGAPTRAVLIRDAR